MSAEDRASPHPQHRAGVEAYNGAVSSKGTQT